MKRRGVPPARPPCSQSAHDRNVLARCAQYKGQYGCIPGKRATGRLIFGSVDPEYAHFRRSSRFIRFHSPNNIDQQIDTIARGKHRCPHRTDIPSTGSLIEYIHHPALIFQRDNGQLMMFSATPCHDVRLNGTDGSGYPDFSQLIIGGVREKLRDGNTVVRGKRNPLRSHTRRAGKRIEGDTQLSVYGRQRSGHHENPGRKEP